MMTSRSEYRLLLRQDNADERLTPAGYRAGLISEERYQAFLEKMERIRLEKARLEKTVIPPELSVNQFLDKHGSAQLKTGIRLADLLRRPEMSYRLLGELDVQRPPLTRAETEEVEIQIKYDGYIARQMKQVEQFKKLEDKKLPEGINYSAIDGLRLEARQKLAALRPVSIGQASRVSGVSPADISVLLIYLEQQKKKQRQGETLNA